MAPEPGGLSLYAVQRLVGRLQDDASKRAAFVTLFDQADKGQLVRFGLLYKAHLQALLQEEDSPQIEGVFSLVVDYLAGKCSWQPARHAAGELYRLAYDHQGVKKRYYQCLAQLACIPHVRFHALWACDFGVAIINLLYPKDMQAVRQERGQQLRLLESVVNEPAQL